MKTVTLGSTGITTPQNAFGALPLQRVSEEAAVALLRRAFEGGMTFFDTARVYTVSEERVGLAFAGMRDQVTIATKSMATTPQKLEQDLETSLRLLQTDHVDIYQLHCVEQCYRPGDGTGLYEKLEEFKRQGRIRHIGITAHKIGVAEEIAASGLYETLQYPLSYLSSAREEALVQSCADANMGFIAMKGLAGGLLTNSRACMAYMTRFDNVVPIWGVQREHELDEWLSYMAETPSYEEMQAYIEADRTQIGGDFCRSCGYCQPCPQNIAIYNCARMSLLLRRMPSSNWLGEDWQAEMERTTACTGCGACKRRCPYGLDIPALLKANYADYQDVLAGRVSVQ